MLTRKLISSGEYLDQFSALPEERRWSCERILHSYEETMRVRPGTGALWLFGYGSLIWNPLLDFGEQQNALLEGWHRSFCLRMEAGRANTETPGRMLALEPGGRTQGVAYRIDAGKVEKELPLVWVREMVLGSYRPQWKSISLSDDSHADALVFVADPAQPQYIQDASVSTVAPLIAAASGRYGSNADYVFQLSFALADRGLSDDYVESLTDELKRICSNRGRNAGRDIHS